MKIITAGRTDIDRFFSMTDVLSAKKRPHHPFLVFVNSQVDKVAEEKLEKLKELEEHYEYQLSGQSMWHQANVGTEMYEKSMKENTEALEKVRKDIAKQEKLLKDNNQAIQVIIVDNARALVTYPPETPVMTQWSGQWSSDFMQFTVQDVIDYLNLNK